jgi:hypothetical protein
VRGPALLFQFITAFHKKNRNIFWLYSRETLPTSTLHLLSIWAAFLHFPFPGHAQRKSDTVKQSSNHLEHPSIHVISASPLTKVFLNAFTSLCFNSRGPRGAKKKETHKANLDHWPKGTRSQARTNPLNGTPFACFSRQTHIIYNDILFFPDKSTPVSVRLRLKASR